MSSEVEQQENREHTFRAFEDGDHQWQDWQEAIFMADHSHK